MNMPPDFAAMLDAITGRARRSPNRLPTPPQRPLPASRWMDPPELTVSHQPPSSPGARQPVLPLRRLLRASAWRTGGSSAATLKVPCSGTNSPLSMTDNTVDGCTSAHGIPPGRLNSIPGCGQGRRVISPGVAE